MLLSMDPCGCTRALALYCWILSGKLLTGPRKANSTRNLLLETARAAKIAHCAGSVPLA